MRPLLALLVLAAIPLAAAEPALIVRGPDDATCDLAHADAVDDACGACVRVWTNPPGATWRCGTEEGCGGAAACLACVRVWTNPPGLSLNCLP